MKGQRQLPGNEPRSNEPPEAADAPNDAREPEGAPPAAAAAPPAAPPASEPPAEEQAPAPKDSRDDIYARARARREQEVAQAVADPQVQTLNQYATGEAPGAPHNSPPPNEPPAAQNNDNSAAPDQPAATPTADAGGDGIRIKVYGEELVVSEDEVLAAGIATLQKERGAEYRLQEAAKTESRLRKYHQELDAYRDRVKAMEQDLRAGKTPSAADAAAAAAPPTSGATVTADESALAESARKAAEAIYRGDPAETAEALKSLLADVAKGRTATPPPVDVKAVAEAAADMVEQRTETRSAEERRQAVNQTFSSEFRDVTAHPEAFAVAQTKFNALLADPSNEGKPWEDLAREAGRAALHRYPELRSAPTGGNEPPAPPAAKTETVDQTLANRRAVKQRTVVRPSTTSARAPAPQPAAVRSNKQFIADLRAARGLPPS